MGGRQAAVATGFVVLMIWLGGCDAVPLLNASQADRAFVPVVLVRTDNLAPPAVTTTSRTFRPEALAPIDDANPAAGASAGFFVTLATGDAEAVRFRLVGRGLASVHELSRIAPPGGDAERQQADSGRAFSDAGRQALREGRGVFWQCAGGAGLETRYGVLLPTSLLTAFTRLEMFAETAADGTPLGAESFELVQDFYYMAVLGDSVMWGNGLEENDKISALVIDAIERETERRVIWQRFAQSGAEIVPSEGDGVCGVGCYGEAPAVSTSITVQVDLVRKPELVELVLMNGCINDVGLGRILDPTFDEDMLVMLTEHFCDTEMAKLLRKVRGLMPNATVVITGYFPFVGPESDISAIRIWDEARDTSDQTELSEEDAAMLAALSSRSTLFVDVAHENLRTAIDTVNDETDGAPRFAFADPGFGPQNAVFAPDALLWGMTRDSDLTNTLPIDIEFELFPEDPVQSARSEVCFDYESPAAIVACLYASVGHPNPAGAEVYADAVLAELRELGVLAE